MGYSRKKKKQGDAGRFKPSNTIHYFSLIETPQNFFITPIGDFKA